MQPLLTSKEARELLRISVSGFYRLVQRGELPAIKVGHLWRFDREKLDQWLESGIAKKN